jgi:hypothetical protein
MASARTAAYALAAGLLLASPAAPALAAADHAAPAHVSIEAGKHHHHKGKHHHKTKHHHKSKHHKSKHHKKSHHHKSKHHHHKSKKQKQKEREARKLAQDKKSALKLLSFDQKGQATLGKAIAKVKLPSKDASALKNDFIKHENLKPFKHEINSANSTKKVNHLKAKLTGIKKLFVPQEAYVSVFKLGAGAEQSLLQLNQLADEIGGKLSEQENETKDQGKLDTAITDIQDAGTRLLATEKSLLAAAKQDTASKLKAGLNKAQKQQGTITQDLTEATTLLTQLKKKYL